MRLKFDRVKSWTLRQVRIKKSRKTNLDAVIGSPQGLLGRSGKLDDILRPHVIGGARVPRKAELILRRIGVIPDGMVAVPGPDAKLDSYGNITKAGWTEFIQSHSDGELFVATGNTPRTRHLSQGIYWRRYNHNRRRQGRLHRTRRNNFQYATRIECLILFKQRTHYRVRLDLARMAQTTVNHEFPAAFAAAKAHASRTAR